MTLKDIIETHWQHKGLSPAKISKAMKGFVGRSGEYKAVRMLRETASCVPKVKSMQDKFSRTKNIHYKS